MTLVTFGETALRFAAAAGERFETADEAALYADGTASTVAATASRLGGESVWISKLPETPLGRCVAAKLHELGLETDVVWTDRETGRQGLTFFEDASAPRAHRLLQDRSGTAMGTLTPGELDMGRVLGADAVFTNATTAALSETAAETTSALLQSTRGLSALDVDFYPDVWPADRARTTVTALLDAVDVVFTAEGDAAAVFDRSGRPRELVHTLASEYDLDLVVLTRAERGAVAYADGVVHEQDAVETEVVDDSGQHDAFVGAFLERVLAGEDVDTALAHGSAAAALAGTMRGPVTPIEAAEVDRLVETRASN